VILSINFTVHLVFHIVDVKFCVFYLQSALVISPIVVKSVSIHFIHLFAFLFIIFAVLAKS